MSDCEKRRGYISSDIYKLPLITDDAPPQINDVNCTDFYNQSVKKRPFKGDFDMCKTHIDGARQKYQQITTECPLSGGMRKRRKSRRTKRKRKSLKKTRRTKRKRKTLKKNRRTRRH
jgi:hypothetical protein